MSISKRMLLAITLVGTLAAPSIAADYSQPAVRDIPTNHWAKDSVKEVVEDYGLMKGDGRGNFSGWKNLSRYELAVVLSNLLSFYNEEFAADREDLSSLANIMEQFQEELKILEARTAEMDAKLAEMEESHGGERNIGQRLVANEETVATMKESGFVLDKLVKGTARDLKHVAYGFSHTPRSSRKARYKHKHGGAIKEVQATNGNGPINTTLEVEAEVLQEVEETVEDAAESLPGTEIQSWEEY